MSDITTLHLVIATPLGVVFDQQVNQLTITTESGELTILPNHIPIVVPLVTGHATAHIDGVDTYHTIDGGVLEVRPGNEVIVLANRSENAEGIDIERANAAIKRAQDLMNQKHAVEDVDFANVERKIAKELNRVKIAQRGRK